MTNMDIRAAIARADLTVPLVFVILIVCVIFGITMMLYGRHRK